MPKYTYRKSSKQSVGKTPVWEILEDGRVIDRIEATEEQARQRVTTEQSKVTTATIDAEALNQAIQGVKGEQGIPVATGPTDPRTPITGEPISAQTVKELRQLIEKGVPPDEQFKQISAKYPDIDEERFTIASAMSYNELYNLGLTFKDYGDITGAFEAVEKKLAEITKQGEIEDKRLAQDRYGTLPTLDVSEATMDIEVSNYVERKNRLRDIAKSRWGVDPWTWDTVINAPSIAEARTAARAKLTELNNSAPGIYQLSLLSHVAGTRLFGGETISPPDVTDAQVDTLISNLSRMARGLDLIANGKQDTIAAELTTPLYLQMTSGLWYDNTVRERQYDIWSGKVLKTVIGEDGGFEVSKFRTILANKKEDFEKMFLAEAATNPGVANYEQWLSAHTNELTIQTKSAYVQKAADSITADSLYSDLDPTYAYQNTAYGKQLMQWAENQAKDIRKKQAVLANNLEVALLSGASMQVSPLDGLPLVLDTAGKPVVSAMFQRLPAPSKQIAQLQLEQSVLDKKARFSTRAASFNEWLAHVQISSGSQLSGDFVRTLVRDWQAGSITDPLQVVMQNLFPTTDIKPIAGGGYLANYGEMATSAATGEKFTPFAISEGDLASQQFLDQAKTIAANRAIGAKSPVAFSDDELASMYEDAQRTGIDPGDLFNMRLGAREREAAVAFDFNDFLSAARASGVPGDDLDLLDIFNTARRTGRPPTEELRTRLQTGAKFSAANATSVTNNLLAIQGLVSSARNFGVSESTLGTIDPLTGQTYLQSMKRTLDAGGSLDGIIAGAYQAQVAQQLAGVAPQTGVQMQQLTEYVQGVATANAGSQKIADAAAAGQRNQRAVELDTILASAGIINLPAAYQEAPIGGQTPTERPSQTAYGAAGSFAAQLAAMMRVGGQATKSTLKDLGLGDFEVDDVAKGIIGKDIEGFRQSIIGGTGNVRQSLLSSGLLRRRKPAPAYLAASTGGAARITA